MNKSQLIDAIAVNMGSSKAHAAAALEGVIGSITDALKHRQEVVLVGFGTFTVKERAARTGTNPQTGKPVAIAAKTAPTFKPGKNLKDAVN